MGSRDEFMEAIEFIERHKIVPIVDRAYNSLSDAEEAFKALDRGGQFGKLVMHVADARQCKI
jgi:zinc-binding alcohol dehydrogenase/oxidoreductase